jgi:hypothetical protein
MKYGRIKAFWKYGAAALTAVVGVLLTIFLLRLGGMVLWCRVVLAAFMLGVYVIPGVVLWREHLSIERSPSRTIRLIPFVMSAGLLAWVSALVIPPLMFGIFCDHFHGIVTNGPLTVIAMTFYLAMCAIGIQMLCAIEVFGYCITKRKGGTQQPNPCDVATRAASEK